MYQRFVVNPPPNAVVVKTSFRDNPDLSEELRLETEHLKATDPDEYECVYERMCRQAVAGAVYKNELLAADKEGRICRVPYDASKLVDTFLDGSEIRLGERLTDTIEKAALYSKSNDNKQFSLSLLKTSAPSRDYGSIALYVDGFCERFYGGGSNAVYAFAKAHEPWPGSSASRFTCAPHPGYALATRFVPAKEVFSSHDPLPVTLEIENVGSIPVAFQVSGKNRGARDNQFGFTAYGPTGAVSDTGDPTRRIILQ